MDDLMRARTWKETKLIYAAIGRQPLCNIRFRKKLYLIAEYGVIFEMKFVFAPA